MLLNLLVQTFFYFVECPAASGFFKAIEGGVGVFDLVQVRNQGLADVEALRPASELGEL
jgi:hypothetical protein